MCLKVAKLLWAKAVIFSTVATSIVIDAPRLKVSSLWACKQLYHVDIRVTISGSDKNLIAQLLNLIFGVELEIIVWAKDFFQTVVSKVNDKTIIEASPIIASKALDLVLI